MAMMMKPIQAYAFLPKTKKNALRDTAKQEGRKNEQPKVENSEINMYEVTCMSSRTMMDERSHHVRMPVGIARR